MVMEASNPVRAGKNIQIKALWESGATVEQISEAFPELSPEAIKITLNSASAAFRREAKNDGQLFNRSNAERAAQLALEMLEDPDVNAGVKYKLIKLTIDESKGRNDVTAQMARIAGELNVNLMSAHYTKMMEAYERSKNMKTIDLTPEQARMIDNGN